MTRAAPFRSLRAMARIFIKSMLLLLILNVIRVVFNINIVDSIININTWGLTGHGRERLVYPGDFKNGQLPIESLLATHELVYRPKAADEYRVLVLGSSGIVGYGLHDQDTFTAQLNARGLKIDGKRVVTYNLAYPSPQVARDIVILDAAVQYQPDLVIWFCTAGAVINTPHKGDNTAFFDLNRARLKRLTDAFGLQSWYVAWMLPEPDQNPWFTFYHQDTLLTWLDSLLYPFSTPDLALINRRSGDELIPPKASYFAGMDGFSPQPNQTWQFFLVGQTLTQRVGAGLLIIDEPTLIGHGPNSDINYNKTYERVFYDNFRGAMSLFTQQHHIWYADLFNVIPASNFTDTALHADRIGYSILVDRVATILKNGPDHALVPIFDF